MADPASRGEPAPKESSVSNAAVTSEGKPRTRGLGATIGKRWRGWLRAIHRDVGYLAVGLTLVYAISGLAINHINDWDPNFKTYERERTIAPIGADVPDDEAIAQARAALGVGRPRSTYRAGDEIHLEFDYKKFVVYGDSGAVVEQGRQPRFLLRVANWLHYNRGKRSWTYIADGYAVLLLYLAISGLFMIKGRNGLKWRGAILLTLGVGVPIGYVSWSGGPQAAASRGQRNAAPEPEADAAGGAGAPGGVGADGVGAGGAGAGDEGGAGDEEEEGGDEFARPPIRRVPPAPGAGTGTGTGTGTGSGTGTGTGTGTGSGTGTGTGAGSMAPGSGSMAPTGGAMPAAGSATP